ncbi:hypothetical protein PMAYCL1PPCAC_02932 [Pristionchus mayeri]|uniref:Uncharacterized protein n=1 Tax=Pristionchus mayeri TaxID=1317129 RepID=A0AAN4Z1C8_9BILA|nr:hypothetical protein PMAYCL1PPCAC_02932 [Pristionchus mayeri]
MSHYRSQRSIPEIPIDAKRTMIDSVSSSESEDDFFSENERESDHSFFSEESSEPSLPVRLYDNQYRSINRDKKNHDERRRHPSCGVPMRRRVQSSSLTRAYHPPPLSSISSSTNESRTTNEDGFDPMSQYTSINKHPVLSPPHRHTRLGMIQELSPIQPCSSSPRGFVSPPPLSWEMRKWKPKHTSSVINAPPLASITRTTHHPPQFFSPPRQNRNSLDLHAYDELLRMDEPRRDPISDMSSDSSYFAYPSAVPRRGISTSSPKRGGRNTPIRPEKFHLPAPVAVAYGVKGIVFVRMEYSSHRLIVDVERAEYFSEATSRMGGGQPQYVRKNLTTHIQLEMVNRSRGEEGSRKRSSQRSHSSSTEYFRTQTVENTDEPKFNKRFIFKLDGRNQRDIVTISVIIEEKFNKEIKRKSQLGCFTFHISQIIEKAERAGYFEDGENNYSVEVINDGYFTLDLKKGRKQNFPMSKIVRKTNYNLEGPSSTSSSSLNVHSPQKMLRSSDWPASSSSHLPSRSSSAIPPPNNIEHRGRARPTSYVEGNRFSEDIMPSLESFENSTGSSSIDYDFNRHRMTLPSITTTSSSITSDENPSCSSSNFNPSYLHPGGSDGKNAKSDENDRKQPSRQEGGVRRAASFTYSPTGSLGKHNRRPEAVVGKEDEAAKKKLFGPLTKTFSYIRSKVDSAISTSSLYPTKDDVRQWENSFEALLNHKYGQMLFTQFLNKEFSSENIEFWTACEEFKKMKDGKKSTTEKANEIYRKFVAEGSPREVNLDSDTRAATKAAMESGCRTDMFTLAQGKIEQLMAKDSYRRFLKDKIYLDMLHHAEGKSEETTENGSAAK